jgi:hypothetical protein
MTEAEEYRIKSEMLLKQAAKATDLDERGRLIAAAAYWNEQARIAEQKRKAPLIRKDRS